PVRLTIIRKYIERTIGGRITLEAAAAIAGMSRFHLSRTFRRWTGHTFYRHVLGARVARAQMLLVTPPLKAAVRIPVVGLIEPPTGRAGAVVE
ncbi:MAG: helix-turn-helix transcriptional regulator, partial [Mycobacterium sp.]|nr:helix-turn-helix transcriptional regulator [Mycobacterium sp.]